MGYPLARSDKPQRDPRVVWRRCVDEFLKTSHARLEQDATLRLCRPGPDDDGDRAVVPFYDLVAIAGG